MYFHMLGLLEAKLEFKSKHCAEMKLARSNLKVKSGERLHNLEHKTSRFE